MCPFPPPLKDATTQNKYMHETPGSNTQQALQVSVRFPCLFHNMCCEYENLLVSRHKFCNTAENVGREH